MFAAISLLSRKLVALMKVSSAFLSFGLPARLLVLFCPVSCCLIIFFCYNTSSGTASGCVISVAPESLEVSGLCNILLRRVT